MHIDESDSPSPPNSPGACLDGYGAHDNKSYPTAERTSSGKKYNHMQRSYLGLDTRPTLGCCFIIFPLYVFLTLAYGVSGDFSKRGDFGNFQKSVLEDVIC